MTTSRESCDTPELPLWHGAAEPVPEPRRADARALARGEASVVQLRAEVEGVGVRGHRARVSVRTQVSPDELAHADRLGARDLKHAVERFPRRDVGQDG